MSRNEQIWTLEKLASGCRHNRERHFHAACEQPVAFIALAAEGNPAAGEDQEYGYWITGGPYCIDHKEEVGGIDCPTVFIPVDIFINLIYGVNGVQQGLGGKKE